MENWNKTFIKIVYFRKIETLTHHHMTDTVKVLNENKNIENFEIKLKHNEKKQ